MSPVIQIYRNISVRHDFNYFLLSIRTKVNKQGTKGCEIKAQRVQDTTEDSGALLIHKYARIWLDTI